MTPNRDVDEQVSWDRRQAVRSLHTKRAKAVRLDDAGHWRLLVALFAGLAVALVVAAI